MWFYGETLSVSKKNTTCRETFFPTYLAIGLFCKRMDNPAGDAVTISLPPPSSVTGGWIENTFLEFKFFQEKPV